MYKNLIVGGMLVTLGAIVGCGPLHTPLPTRLDEEAQKSADQSWNDAFTPADRLDHQSLLDAFVSTQAYQNGVDKLALRSEKKLKNGLVIMEIHFDRLKPDDDRFEVSVYDEANERIRHERYSRDELERTYKEIFPEIPSEKMQGEPAEWTQQREKAKQRRQAVERLLPKTEGQKKDA